MLALRREHRALRPVTFLSGAEPHGDVIPDLSWYDAYGVPLSDEKWSSQESRVFQMLRSGTLSAGRDALVVFNGTTSDRHVLLPRGRGRQWVHVLDTAWAHPEDGGITSLRDACTLPEALERKTPDASISLEPFSLHIYLSALESSPRG